MKKEYIPVLVEVSGKKELWRMDVTKLSITQLIELRETLITNEPYIHTIRALDGLIKRDIETIVPSHNINNCSYMRVYKKNKKEEKQLKRTKKRRR